jgi:group I intron endonuclease
MSCGIYKIKNNINGKCYIGQSIHIEKRWINHKSDMGKFDYPLYLAFFKYGLENFSFEIVEECLKEGLNEREIFWISQFNSYLNGYNQTLGGNQCSHNIKISDEDLLIIFELLQNSELTQREIAKQFDVGEDTISEINTGKTRLCDNIIYPIRVFKKQRFCSQCLKSIKFGEICQECHHLNQRKAERPSKEVLSILLKQNSFCAVGRMFNVSDNAIRKWCKSYGLSSKAIDYK